MINLCTLFDSGYLDRGIVLYQSLEQWAKEFCLYVLCLDETAFRGLQQLDFKNIVVISESQILSKELSQIKLNRKKAEYCWTCTPVIIQYVLDNYQVAECTYIDADMVFYQDPEILLDELKGVEASVGIIGHRFPQNIAKNKKERYYGKYCVEFNTFINDERGRKVLDSWKRKCFQQCTMELGKNGYGDQKYIEKWENEFEGIYEYQYMGAGVAPWNIADYKPYDLGKKIRLRYKDGKIYNLIFYHYQSLMILSGEKAFIGVYNELGYKNDKLISHLYENYIIRLMQIRLMLKEIGIIIPEQEIREGEKSIISKMNIKDFIIFCYQCIPCIINKRKNYIDINQLMTKFAKK